MTTPLRLGTRRSALAMAQSGDVADLLAARIGRSVDLVGIVSDGDTSRASLAQIGGTGVFATRLREALGAGECDLLVHSLKDLPTAPARGLTVAASPVREDARDVILTRDGTPLADLPAGSKVGTGSPRRMAQVRMVNPSVDLHDLRGNIDSRSSRVRDGELDAVVLAAAGLRRLGIATDLHWQELELATWPTAAGQGALAVEIRLDAADDVREAVESLSDLDTDLAVAAERQVLATLEAGCHAPVGVHAGISGGKLSLHATVYGAEPSVVISGRSAETLGEGYHRAQGGADDGPEGRRELMHRARDCGRRLAEALLHDGAAQVVR